MDGDTGGRDSRQLQRGQEVACVGEIGSSVEVRQWRWQRKKVLERGRALEKGRGGGGGD